jgi:hypothetical protein
VVTEHRSEFEHQLEPEGLARLLDDDENDLAFKRLPGMGHY